MGYLCCVTVFFITSDAHKLTAEEVPSFVNNTMETTKDSMGGFTDNISRQRKHKNGNVQNTHEKL